MNNVLSLVSDLQNRPSYNTRITAHEVVERTEGTRRCVEVHGPVTGRNSGDSQARARMSYLLADLVVLLVSAHALRQCLRPPRVQLAHYSSSVPKMMYGALYEILDRFLSCMS